MRGKIDLSSWEGKTIFKVVNSGPEMEAEAAIAIFVFTDGSRARLHANDLGEWVINLPPEGKPYQSWSQLMYEFGSGSNSEQPIVEILPGILRLTNVSNGRTYDLDLESPVVKSWHWTNKVLTNPHGLDLLSEAAVCGEFWRIVFNKASVDNGDVPEELLLTPEDIEEKI